MKKHKHAHGHLIRFEKNNMVPQQDESMGYTMPLRLARHHVPLKNRRALAHTVVVVRPRGGSRPGGYCRKERTCIGSMFPHGHSGELILQQQKRLHPKEFLLPVRFPAEKSVVAKRDAPLECCIFEKNVAETAFVYKRGHTQACNGSAKLKLTREHLVNSSSILMSTKESPYHYESARADLDVVKMEATADGDWLWALTFVCSKGEYKNNY
jgi:hypothetical protein